MINPYSIVGLDLSLTGTGVACFGDSRTVKSNAKLDIEPRVDKIISELFAVIDELSNKSANLFVIEGLAFASKTGKVAERCFLHHEVRYQLWKQNKKFAIVAPTARAKFASSRGNAGKDEVMIAVTRQWPEFNAANNNEADAVTMYQMGIEHYLPGTIDLPKLNLDALQKVVWPNA